MKLIIAGDFCPIGRLAAYNKEQDLSSIIGKNVCEIISAADFSVLNLECPIADDKDIPIVKDGPNLRCSHLTYDLISRIGFNTVTLANNHFRDFGDSSIKKTIEKIRSLELNYVGGGLTLEEAKKPLYLEKDGIKVAVINCCEHESSIATDDHGGSNPIDIIPIYYSIIDAKKNADYVVIITHGGHEHYQLPSPRMKETYRFFVDAGADAVINHHQHCYSGYEVYKEKPIFYGLGNFLFDTLLRKDKKTWHEGYFVTLEFIDKISYNIHPYKQAKDSIFFELLNSQEKIKFDENLEKLNGIIKNQKELVSSFQHLVDQKSKDYLYLASPYLGRYMAALFKRNLLPSWFNKRKLILMNNYLNCESHFDLLKKTILNKLGI